MLEHTLYQATLKDISAFSRELGGELAFRGIHIEELLDILRALRSAQARGFSTASLAAVLIEGMAEGVPAPEDPTGKGPRPLPGPLTGPVLALLVPVAGLAAKEGRDPADIISNVVRGLRSGSILRKELPTILRLIRGSLTWGSNPNRLISSIPVKHHDWEAEMVRRSEVLSFLAKVANVGTDPTELGRILIDAFEGRTLFGRSVLTQAIFNRLQPLILAVSRRNRKPQVFATSLMSAFESGVLNGENCYPVLDALELVANNSWKARHLLRLLVAGIRSAVMTPEEHIRFTRSARHLMEQVWEINQVNSSRVLTALCGALNKRELSGRAAPPLFDLLASVFKAKEDPLPLAIAILSLIRGGGDSPDGLEGLMTSLRRLFGTCKVSLVDPLVLAEKLGMHFGNPRSPLTDPAAVIDALADAALARVSPLTLCWSTGRLVSLGVLARGEITPLVRIFGGYGLGRLDSEAIQHLACVETEAKSVRNRKELLELVGRLAAFSRDARARFSRPVIWELAEARHRVDGLDRVLFLAGVLYARGIYPMSELIVMLNKAGSDGHTGGLFEGAPA